VSTHAPQFWDKIILFQNYLSWSLHASTLKPLLGFWLWARVSFIFPKLPLSSSLGHSGYIPLFALLASHRNLPERQTLVNLEPQSQQSILLSSQNLGGGSSTRCCSTNACLKIQIYSPKLGGDCRLHSRVMTQRPPLLIVP
jgi:hypothetical protein